MWRRDTLKSRLLRSLIPERIPWFAARLYDQIARTAIKTYYTEVAEAVIAHLCEGLVLDVGTGPGYLPLEIVKRAPLITAIGIDSSKAMVRIAHTNAEIEGLKDRVRFVKCDANRLGLDNDSCDLVISTGSLHAWKNPMLVINECFRVLKPGGEAWLLDPAQVITPEAQQFMGGNLKLVDRLASWWGSFTSKLTPPYKVGEIHEIIGRTRFQEGTVEEGKWLTVKLRKRVGQPSHSTAPNDEASR